MTQDFAPDEPAEPRLYVRVSSAAGAVLGIALALLVAMLPGGAHAGRAQPAFSAAAADQCLPFAGDRAGEARRSLYTPKGPNARRPDFDDGFAPVSASAALCRIAPTAASPQTAQARTQRPARWLSTARARAPPLA